MFPQSIILCSMICSGKLTLDVRQVMSFNEVCMISEEELNNLSNDQQSIN